MEICSNICSLQDAPISRPFSWNVSLKHTSNLCRYHIVYFTTSYRYSKQQKYMIKGKTKILLPELHRLWHFSYQTLFMWRKNFNFRIKEFSSGDFVIILINFRVSLRPKHQKRRTTTTNQLLGSACIYVRGEIFYPCRKLRCKKTPKKLMKLCSVFLSIIGNKQKIKTVYVVLKAVIGCRSFSTEAASSLFEIDKMLRKITKIIKTKILQVLLSLLDKKIKDTDN